jgi:HPt (histidine-containing phosphotransfer) domain-containing protein
MGRGFAQNQAVNSGESIKMTENGIDLSVFAALKETMGADFIGELVDTYLEDSQALIQQMHQALAAQDADSFRRAAHSLKSNSASFGAMQLSSLARELEFAGKENRLDQTGETLARLETEYTQVSTELEALRDAEE